jgi:nucleoside-diphosphate-sugar epimerase
MKIEGFRSEFARFEPDVVIDMFAMTETSARSAVSAVNGICARAVIVSSADVYRAYGMLIGTEPGELEPLPIDEDRALRTKFYPYAEKFPAGDWRQDYDKILVERVYREAMNTTVLRLPMVYGPNDYQHRMWEFVKRVLDGRNRFVQSESYAAWRVTRCFVRNAAHAIVLAAVSGRGSNSVYNVGERNALSTMEWSLKISSAMKGSLEPATAPNGSLPSVLQDDGNYDQHLILDSSRIRRELGFEEIVSTEDAIRETVLWEAANPPENGGPGEDVYAAEDAFLKTVKT